MVCSWNIGMQVGQFNPQLKKSRSSVQLQVVFHRLVALTRVRRPRVEKEKH